MPTLPWPFTEVHRNVSAFTTSMLRSTSSRRSVAKSSSRSIGDQIVYRLFLCYEAYQYIKHFFASSIVHVYDFITINVCRFDKAFWIHSACLRTTNSTIVLQVIFMSNSAMPTSSGERSQYPEITSQPLILPHMDLSLAAINLCR
jgi:hypothetical protein